MFPPASPRLNHDLTFLPSHVSRLVPRLHNHYDRRPLWHDVSTGCSSTAFVDTVSPLKSFLGGSWRWGDSFPIFLSLFWMLFLFLWRRFGLLKWCCSFGWGTLFGISVWGFGEISILTSWFDLDSMNVLGQRFERNLVWNSSRLCNKFSLKHFF